jgi:hypothetical protein
MYRNTPTPGSALSGHILAEESDAAGEWVEV